MDPHAILLNDLRLAGFGAELRGSASLYDFARYQLRGNISNLALRTIAQIAGYQRIGYDGIVTGAIDARGNLSAPAGRDLDVDARLAISPSGSVFP